MSRKLTKSEIIEKSNIVHNNKYDYAEFEKESFIYENTKSKIPIICHKKDCDGIEHGIFLQTPLNHMHGQGCPICGGSKKKRNEDFIKDAFNEWGELYTYENVTYINCKTKISVTCKKHGDFLVTPDEFLNNHNGCPKCKFDKLRKTQDDFIEESKKIYGENTFTYDKVEYVNNQTKVILTCKEHGDFLKTPNQHLSQKQGCPICGVMNKVKSKLENDIADLLSANNVKYIREYRNNGLFGKLSLDFFLPEYNVGIECQGEQHFKPAESKKSYFNEAKVKAIKKRDECKRKICEENGITLIYYSNLGIEYPYEVFENRTDLLNKIFSIKKC